MYSDIQVRDIRIKDACNDNHSYFYPVYFLEVLHLLTADSLLFNFGWMSKSLLSAPSLVNPGSSSLSASGDLSIYAVHIRTRLWRSQLGPIANKFSTEMKQLAEGSCCLW